MVESFLKIKVTRHEDGIFLYLKSPKIESWIKSLCYLKGNQFENLDNYSYSRNWEKVYGYPISDEFDELEGLHRWGEGLFIKKNPNLAFFRAKGLSDGVSFKVNGMYSDERIKLFISSAREELKQLYNYFLKPLHYSEEIEI